MVITTALRYHPSVLESFRKNERRGWELLAWLAVVAGLVGLALRMGPHFGWFVEDAYISFRFAHHFADGHGLVWNIGGERVDGFTSPLHVALLALGFRLGFSDAFWASTLNFGSVALCIAAFAVFLRRRVGLFAPIAGAVMFAFLVDGYLAVHATAGLDTPMYMALLAWNTVIAQRFLTRPGLVTSLALALINLLCLLGRPDAAPFLVGQGLVLLVLGLIDLRDGQPALPRNVVTTYAILVTAGVAYLGWKLSYFGSILPNPFYIKSNGVGLDGLGDVLKFLGRFPARVGWIVLAALPFLDFEAVRDVFRNDRARLALLLVPPATFLLYYTTVIHEVGYLSRFEYPAYLPLLMAIAWLLAVGRPVQRAFERLTDYLPAATSLAVLALAALLPVWLTWKFTWTYFPWIPKNHAGYYGPVGEALATTGLEKDASLVFDSAGVVPYTSKFTHIDPVGLVDNTLSGRTPITAIEREEYLWGRHPDVYIGPVPPASNGSTSCTDEPLMRSGYVEAVLFSNVDGGPYQRSYGELSSEERCAANFLRMRILRDDYELLGEIPFPVRPVPEYTTFVHVRRDSPYGDRIGAALEPLFERGPDQIRADLARDTAATPD